MTCPKILTWNRSLIFWFICFFHHKITVFRNVWRCVIFWLFSQSPYIPFSPRPPTNPVIILSRFGRVTECERMTLYSIDSSYPPSISCIFFETSFSKITGYFNQMYTNWYSPNSVFKTYVFLFDSNCVIIWEHLVWNWRQIFWIFFSNNIWNRMKNMPK